VPFPGETDRVLDRVAHLDDPDRPAEPVALDLEFQTENAPDILERMLEYVARLRRELRHGPDQRGRYRAVGALVNLTGPAQPDTLAMALGGPTGVGLRFQVILRTLRDEDAGRTLADIAAGRVTRALLPLIPLLRGGRDRGTILTWVQVAAAEPDEYLRATYGGLARVFARATKGRPAWAATLEGWEVRKSPVVEEWREEGRVIGMSVGRLEGARSMLLKAIERRFRAPVPEDLREAVTALDRLPDLDRWFDLVFTSRSLAAYRRAVGR
jgi:hypothetical protein